MQVRLHTSVWHKLEYQASRAPFNTYTDQLDKIAVMQTTQHLNLCDELTISVLVFPSEQFDSNLNPILNYAAINTSIPSFAYHSVEAKFVCCLLKLRN